MRLDPDKEILFGSILPDPDIEKLFGSILSDPDRETSVSVDLGKDAKD